MRCSKRWVFLVFLGVLSACSERTVPLDVSRTEVVRELAARVDPGRLMARVQRLIDARRYEIPFDCARLPQGVDPLFCHLTRERLRELLESGFREAGLEVKHQAEASGDFPTYNVVAELPGTSHPERIILVGAHYDAFHDGADDNTSGVATLLELAEVLGSERFASTVRFVAFDHEELGLVGSTRYVGSGAASDVVLALILDCVGFYSTEPGSQMSLPGLPSPDTGDFLAAIANDASARYAVELAALGRHLDSAKVVPLVSPGEGLAPLVGDLTRSDHTPFWLAGGTALFLTDTASFRNPHYHKESDTLDTLNPVLFGRTVQLLAGAVAYWAERAP